MNNKEIAALRREYSSKSLSESDVATNPIDQFGSWWNEAIQSDILEANAMTLATASNDGMPYARVVLLKGYDQSGFRFYTNYNSIKGLQLKENPRACLLFYWKELERQVRIIGRVEKVSDQENDEYFYSRPEGSRIGAWTSPQSEVIESRDWLDVRFQEIAAKLAGGNIERPPHWGGYLIKPFIIEFWQGRLSRLHDRIQYSLQEDASWKIERLAP
jgi:pyridoxamine 5'-phosphate oxidase